MRMQLVFTAPTGMTQVWSPTLWQMDGRWWIYFTAQVNGQHGIFALGSDTADVLGTYSYMGELDTCSASIDPSLLQFNNAQYLMYVTVDSGENAIWIHKLATPMAFDGNATLIAAPPIPLGERTWVHGNVSSQRGSHGTLP